MPPIHTSYNHNARVYEVYYFDRLIGWLSSGKTKQDGKPVWRALSTHGDLRHTKSLHSARSALVEMVQ
jgi:hypothetical protein